MGKFKCKVQSLGSPTHSAGENTPFCKMLQHARFSKAATMNIPTFVEADELRDVKELA